MVSKTIVGQPTVGSNPTPSATVMSLDMSDAPNPAGFGALLVLAVSGPHSPALRSR
jgi:hypothetical protein